MEPVNTALYDQNFDLWRPSCPRDTLEYYTARNHESSGYPNSSSFHFILGHIQAVRYLLGYTRAENMRHDIPISDSPGCLSPAV